MTPEHLKVLLSLLLSPVVVAGILVFGAVAALGARWLRRTGRAKAPFALTWLTLFTIGCVISLTLVRGMWGQTGDASSSSVLLSFDPAGLFRWDPDGLSRLADNPFTRPDIWLNFLLFVPVGLLLVLLTGRFWWSVAGIFAGTMLIELSQGLFHLGAPDVADLITNFAGGLAGATLAVAISSLVSIPGVRRRPRRDLVIALGGAAVTGALAALVIPAVAQWQQHTLYQQASQTFDTTDLTEYTRWQQSGPDIVEQRLFSALSVRVDDSRGDPTPQLRWPATFLGVRRCVVAEFRPQGVAVTRRSGDSCSQPLAQQ